MTSFLSRILVANVPLIWLRAKSRSCHSTQEELMEFGRVLDWKILFNEIETNFQRGYADPVGISKARRVITKNSVCRPELVVRYVWPRAVGSSPAREPS